jgi:hypothetical protein
MSILVIVKGSKPIVRSILLIACTVLSCPFLIPHANATGNTRAEKDSIDCNTGNSKAKKDSIDYEYDFVISASGSYSSPKNLFSDNYKSAIGFMFGVGVASTAKSDSIPGTFTFLLTYSRDYFEISDYTRAKYSIDKDPEATISALQLRLYSDSAHVSFKGIGIYPVFGGGIGGAKFSITDENFDKMGKTTLTELKHENNKTQLSTFGEFGIKLSGLGPVSLHYSYQLMEVQRTWKYFHWFVSTSIQQFTKFGIPARVNKSVGEDVKASRKYQLATVLYKVGMTILWYQITYDHNNWPFKDEAPLHYHRQLLTLTFPF